MKLRISPGIILVLFLITTSIVASSKNLIEAESLYGDEVDIDSLFVCDANFRQDSPGLSRINECESSRSAYIPKCLERADSVENLFWCSADHTDPTRFKDTTGIQSQLELRLVSRIDAQVTDGIYVLVNISIYSDVQSQLDQYVLDVSSDGYWVEVYTIQGGSPEDVRVFLQGGLSGGLVGCLFVGDVPEPWYEMYGCWGGGNEEFPIDLFYMDLNGLWADSDSDGVFDGHSGDVAPEIWVGRLKASNIEGDEVQQINNYFEKNHLYRIGIRTAQRRALVYIDDDWTDMAEDVNSSLSEIYDGMTDVIVDGATTTAEDYKSRIAEGYEWVHLQCHGWSGGHSFMIGDEWTGGTVYSSNYLTIDPPVFFYQLFVCSGARFIEHDYLAGSCIFTDEYGLLAIGSTKTGSMLYFSDFYGNLAEGDCIGEAFRRWHVEYGEVYPCWFYGLSIIGDPTLIPAQTHSRPVARVRVFPEALEFGPEPVVGQNFVVSVVIENATDLCSLDIELHWNTTYIEYVNHTATIPIEDYLDPVSPSPYSGILHNPILEVKNEVDISAGIYWAVFSTMGKSGFNGNGTVFVMTFRIVHQPPRGEEDIMLSLNLAEVSLANSIPIPIPHEVVNGSIIIEAFKLHDIAIVNVTSFKSAVGQNYTAIINVIIENQGDYFEAFFVTACANTTTVGTQIVFLNSGYYATTSFIWNTTGFSKGNYTTSAYTSLVTGETDTTDNTNIDGIVTVTIPGDVDGDFDVDIYDVVKLCWSYCSETGDPHFDANCDIDCDDDVDIYDVVILCSHYGEEYL